MITGADCDSDRVMAMAERPDLRRHIRIPSILPVDFQLRGGGGERFDPEIRTAFTRDLSEGGLRLEITTLPEVVAARLRGKEPLTIEVDIALPGRTLRIPGRVAWRGPGADTRAGWVVGVQFTDVSAADAAAITEYARQAARRPVIVKTVLAAMAVLLVVGGLVYWWNTGILTHRIETTRQALVKSEQEVAQVSDSLGDRQLEIGWLATQVRELADVLDEREGRVPPPAEPGKSPAQELARAIQRLRASILKPQAATKEHP